MSSSGVFGRKDAHFPHDVFDCGARKLSSNSTEEFFGASESASRTYLL